ncbi:LysR substrate-binding domain-containing protein [Maridesulfovibrio zosterae]|uniref:LysR substrate-binding domain-containing protein n=1 Tax=Maridesulfovibrio zosterae TaxID=82171 RepID=UPI0004040D19|nr:LysR substrate-binding domain-containing protein [Maridesulfovibrio zosterae]
METRQLKYFVAVAEELHFGRAAKRLYISQPPLSQQIMKFEDELGVKLFKRNKRSVELTAAGKSFLEDARTVLRSIERAQDNLEAFITGEGGRLSLGYIGPSLETTFADIVREYKTAYPGVQFVLNEMFTNDQLKAVRTGTIDAGIVRLFQHDVSDLESIMFHKESYALVLPTGHKFSEQKSVDVSELSGEPLIFFPRESQPLLYDEWMRVFNDCGFIPNIVQEAGTKAAALALAAAQIGISIVPESLARRNQQGVFFKKMTGDYPTLELHVIYRKGESFAALDNFLKIVEKWADKEKTIII